LPTLEHWSMSVCCITVGVFGNRFINNITLCIFALSRFIIITKIRNINFKFQTMKTKTLLFAFLLFAGLSFGQQVDRQKVILEIGSATW